MLKRLYILIFSLFYAATLVGQDAQTLYAYAQEQQQNKHYEQAIKAYNRILFFDIEHYQDAVHQLATCYYQVGDLEKAIEFFRMTRSMHSFSDSIRFEASIKVALLRMAQQQPKLALLELDESESIEKSFPKRIALARGVAHFMLHEYDESEKNFVQLIEPDNLADFNYTFERVNRLSKKYKPMKYQTMSLIVPGSGQMVLGELEDGVNSLLINSLMLGLYVHNLQYLSILDATLAIYPWQSRYYLGGYRKVAEIAHDRKTERLNESLLHILSLCEE